MFADLPPSVVADILAGILIAMVSAAFVWLRKTAKGLGQMTRDWNGEPARPGIADGTPGVMQRLYTQDRQFEAVLERLDRQDTALEEIQHEINYNSGQSLKDFAKRTHDSVEDLSAKLDEHIKAHGAAN